MGHCTALALVLNLPSARTWRRLRLDTKIASIHPITLPRFSPLMLVMSRPNHVLRMQWIALLCLTQWGCAQSAQVLIPPEPQPKWATRGLPRGPAQGAQINPGEEMIIPEVDRLSAWAITVTPAHLEPYLEVRRVGVGIMGARLEELTTPDRLRDGQLFMQTGAEPAIQYSVKLSRDAPAQAHVSVKRVTTARALHYWEHRRDVLLAALDDDLQNPIPPGMGLPGDDDASRATQLGKELLAAAGYNDAGRVAARHIARAWVLREVARSRNHATRYHERRKLDGWVGEFEARLTSERDPVEKMWSVGLTSPQQIIVEGPARIDFRVRGVLPKEEPDERLDFSIEILDTTSGIVLHRADMSSRAALMNVPTELDDGTTRQIPRRLKGGDGELLTWARETSFWVPPGTHRYIINAPNADVRLDADLLRTRPIAQDQVDRRLDITYQLELARRALALAPEHVQHVFGVELDLFTHQINAAHTGLFKRASPLSSDAPLACWTYWRAMQHLPLEPDATLTRRCATQRELPERNTRLLDINARKLIKSKDFAQTLETLELAANSQDERLIRDRAQVWLLGGPTESARWFGMGLLLADWAAHPLDRERRDATQRAWWYRTRWQRLNPDGRHARYEFLEKLGPEFQKISMTRLAERKGVLFRLRPGEPHEVMLEPAPDDPERPARLRLLGVGFDDIDYHVVRVDEQEQQFVRTTPFERMDLAVPPGTHMLVAGERNQEARLFSYDPPINRATMRASDVVERRRYARISPRKSLVWTITPARAPRQVRLMLRMTEPLKSQKLTIELGAGEHRHLELVGAPTDTFEDAAPTLVFEVPTGSDRIELSLDSADAKPLFASLEVRQVGASNQPLPLDPGVIKGLAIPEIEHLEMLTREIAQATDTLKKTELRVERAELLMRLDQEAIAKVDLQAVLLTPQDAGDLWTKAWQLMLGVEIRESSNWLKSPRIRPGQVMPLRLSGHVINTPLDTPGECLLAWRKGDVSAAQAHSDACLHALAYVTLRERARDRDVPPEQMLPLWRRLIALMRDHRHTWAVKEGFARALLDRVEAAPDKAPVGDAAQAYGLALDALYTWPGSRVRSSYYRGLRWTGWDTIKPSAKGRASGVTPPTQEVENIRELLVTPYTLIDPRKDAVEFAMLGSLWPHAQSFSLISGVNHRKRFVAPVNGTLTVQATCQDIRPDLQPPDHKIPCDWMAELFDADGTPVPEVDYPNGTRRDTRAYPIKANAHYDMRVRRLDTLRGREFAARAHIKGATPWHYGRASVLTFDRNEPLRLDVAGPVVLRLDLRQMQDPIAGQQAIITHTAPSGEIKEYTVELSTEELDALPFDDKRALGGTQPMRHMLWLAEQGSHNVSISSNFDQTMGVRIAARVDDYTEELRSDGQGWRRTPDEVLTDKAPTTVVNEELFAAVMSRRLELGELDLSPPPARPWVVGGESGWRARDLGGELAIRERARDRSYFYAEAMGSVYWPKLNLWLTPDAGVRTSVGMRRTLYAGGRATLMYDSLERLRFELDATLAHQRVINDKLRSLRGFAGVQYKVDWSERWSQRAWVRARWRPEFGPDSQDLDRTDPLIRSAYAADHPLTYDLESAWRWRPFMDAWLDVGGTLRLNTIPTPDQLRLKVGASMRFGQEVVVGLDLLLNPLFKDTDRSRTFFYQELRGDLEWWGWHLDEHWFGLGGFGSVGVLLPSDRPMRLRGGVILSYRYSHRGWEAIPPSQSIVKDLRQPLYFGRRVRPEEESP